MSFHALTLFVRWRRVIVLRLRVVLTIHPVRRTVQSSDEGDSERVCASPQFFYTIGEYETSSFYREFLSDEAVRSSHGRMVTVREMTDEMSRNPKSCFRSWFRIPLYMVCEIVDRFIEEGWIRISHHCRTMDRLRIKAELLVLGTLAMLGGTLMSFRQLKPLTHIVRQIIANSICHLFVASRAYRTSMCSCLARRRSCGR